MAPHPTYSTAEALVILRRFSRFNSDGLFGPAAERDLEHCRAVLLSAAGRDARILQAAEVVEHALQHWRAEEIRAIVTDVNHACSILSAL